MTIAPNDTVSGIIFVALENFKDTFTIILSNKETQEKIYYEVSCK